MDKVNVAESDDAITVTGKTSKTNGKAFEVVIDKAQGYITSYKVDGQEPAGERTGSELLPCTGQQRTHPSPQR